MRKSSLFTMFIILALVFFYISSSNANAAQNLIFANMCSPKSVMAQGFEWWGSEVEKRTNGKVKFEYYWGASLVKPYEQNSAVMNNVIQVGTLTAYNPDIQPWEPIFLAPMLNTGNVKDTLQVAADFWRENQIIQDWLKKNNLKFLYQGIYANQYIWSKVPVNSLKDLKGLSVRTFGPFLALFQALGSKLMSVPVPEIYSSLERGAVKATTLYLTLGAGFKIYEVTKYLVTSNLGHCPLPIVMNINAWNKLPDDVKKVIEDININEITPKYVELDRKGYKKEMKIAKDSGMVFSKLPDSDMKKLRDISYQKVWKPYVEKLDKKGIPGSKVLDQYIKALKKNGLY